MSKLQQMNSLRACVRPRIYVKEGESPGNIYWAFAHIYVTRSVLQPVTYDGVLQGKGVFFIPMEI